jgi:peptide/nickel transport system permease protein
MTTYILRRLLFLPVVMLGLSLLIFTMMQFLSPTQRLTAFVSDPTKLRSGDTETLIEIYGLDDPVHVQYARWISHLLRGDLGYSTTVSLPVSSAIARYFPATLELVLFSAIPVIFGGIWMGTLSATRHNRLLDHGIRVVAIVGWSLPTFVAGLLALMVFYGLLNWFPPGRTGTWAVPIIHEMSRYTGLYTIDALLNGQLGVFLDAVRHLVAPVATISFVSWALILRITRSSMLETLRQDYITTARSKGLRERKVVRKHARRNALIPVVTTSGLLMASMVGGVVVVESVFGYKGIGWWATEAARQFDFPAIIGFALFNATMLVLINLVVDILYAVIDPRIRLQ